MRRIHLRDVPEDLYIAIRHAAVDARSTINGVVLAALSRQLLHTQRDDSTPHSTAQRKDDTAPDTQRG